MNLQMIKDKLSPSTSQPVLNSPNFQLLRWDDSTGDQCYDLILGCDCLFFKEYHGDLVRLLDRLLTNSGVALLMQPRRHGTLDLFIQQLTTNSSLHVEVVEDFHPEVSWIILVVLSSVYRVDY